MVGIINPVRNMTSRERFLNVFSFKNVDHVPDVEFGYMRDTLNRWHDEGLPIWITDNIKANMFFGFEGRRSEIPIGEKLPLGLPFPMDFRLIVPFKYYEEKVLSADSRCYTIQDEFGRIFVQWKRGVGDSIPQFLEFPVKDRESWLDYKSRFDINNIRYPKNWEMLKEKYKERSYPLGIDGGGYFGWARHLIGLERLSIIFYRDPDLIREIFAFRTNMVLRAIEKAVREVKPTIDFAHWWEDMCYNKGPMISPKLFAQFLVPEYKRITSFLKNHGIWINIMDCDGDINHLVPLWLEAGINCMFPLEVRAGTNPLSLRESYGKRLLLMGGVDKMALINGKKAIRKELDKLAPLIDEGGYIPHVDHRVPPDISYENYLYYLAQKRKLLFKTSARLVPFYYFDYILPPSRYWEDSG